MCTHTIHTAMFPCPATTATATDPKEGPDDVSHSLVQDLTLNLLINRAHLAKLNRLHQHAPAARYLNTETVDRMLALWRRVLTEDRPADLTPDVARSLERLSACTHEYLALHDKYQEWQQKEEQQQKEEEEGGGGRQRKHRTWGEDEDVADDDVDYHSDQRTEDEDEDKDEEDA